MNTNASTIAFPIDLVYLWVDGNDAAWQAKRQTYMTGAQTKSTSADATSEARWRNNDELLFSLRSVEMYAPWVNHIYIITDNQRPEWLVPNHPKVTIVDHVEIFPPEAIPIFNSGALEACIHKIKGLSEHFLFANDDTLFAQRVEPTDFFLPDGRPIVRFMHFSRRKAHRKGHYHRMLYRMQNLAKEQTGRLIALAPHHNIDAYCKSAYAHCVEQLYPEEWHQTIFHRFREEGDMHRSFVAYWMVATGNAVMRRVGRYNRVTGGLVGHLRAFLSGRYATDSRVVSANLPDYEKVMRKYNPLMICANDNEHTTPEDCKRMHAFLQARYPVQSSFEKR